MIDVAKIEQVLAVHRHGSFARAAQALGVSQPSLSRSIARLEDQLKARLFERGPAGAELTPIGELVVERGTRVVAGAEALARDAVLFAGGEAGAVRIGASFVLRDDLMRDLLLTLAMQRPNLRIESRLGDRTSLYPQLVARELDLALLLTDGEETDATFATVHLAEIEVIVVAAPGHPLAAARRVSGADLARHKSAGPPSWLIYDKLGVPDSTRQPFYAGNDYAAMLGYAAAGLAYTVAPRFIAKRWLDEGEVVAVDLAERVSLDLSGVTLRAAASAPVLRFVMDQARELAAGMLAQANAG